MLPACRSESEAFAIPTFEITGRDVDGFLDELRIFHTRFRTCFARSEPREHFFNYMVGQLSALERKSIEPMALHVEGGNIRGMQRCMSDDVWDEDLMRQTYHGLVAEEMGDPEGVLMFDESGFVKKGKESVGVARQYCGTLGKVENSQVGVFAGYASRQGYALVDTRLFMPEPWFTEDYTDRRAKCNVPDDVTFHTKPQLAVEMLRAIRSEGRLPFKYVVADCLYGNSPDFLDALDACLGVTSLVSVPAETRCWLQRPPTTEHTYPYKGEVRSKRVVAPETQAPLTVAAVAASLPSAAWSRRTVSAGTKGPIVYELSRKRVTLCKEGVPERTVWLVIKRTLGASPTYAYDISNAPASTPLRLLVWFSGVRWAIELLFKEWKSYANLHAFDTENPAIVEGLIWTAIAAAALKRFLAHMTQLLVEVPMSTRKVAMCAMHVLGDLVEALKSGDVAGLYAALEAAITYLACHARRAHPKRDRQTGRSQLGLEPFFAYDDMIEFVEAA